MCILQRKAGRFPQWWYLHCNDMVNNNQKIDSVFIYNRPVPNICFDQRLLLYNCEQWLYNLLSKHLCSCSERSQKVFVWIQIHQCSVRAKTDQLERFILKSSTPDTLIHYNRAGKISFGPRSNLLHSICFKRWGWQEFMWIFANITIKINLVWVWKELHLVILYSYSHSLCLHIMASTWLYCVSLSLSQPQVSQPY